MLIGFFVWKNPAFLQASIQDVIPTTLNVQSQRSRNDEQSSPIMRPEHKRNVED
jgi:hypothetical protein